MTQPKSVDQKDPTWQRTVLLATDGAHSIIAEIADGKTNPIAYSAYGQQSAQQEVATRLGFNGQLREMQSSWYLLGNGYRAYNPRLMRFHSPDSWSPFGGGGLNAYMYCVGDPVNRADPTGHFFGVFKLVAQDLRPYVGFASSADSLASKSARNMASASGRQKAVSELTANTGRNFESSDPGGTARMFAAAAFKANSVHHPYTPAPPTSAPYHKYDWGVAPKQSGATHGIVYLASRSSPSPSPSPSHGSSGMRTSSGGLPSYAEATSKTGQLWTHDTFAASQQGQTYTVNRMAVHRMDNLGAAAPYQAPAGAPPPPVVVEHNQLLQGIAELNNMQRDVIQHRAASIRCQIL